MTKAVCILMLAVLPACLSRAQTAENWAVMTGSGARTAASVGFSADGASLVCRDALASAVAIPVSSVVALMQRSPAPALRPIPARRFYAELSSGERMLADAVELEQGTLRIANSRWGSVNLSTGEVWRLVADDTRLPEVPASFAGVRHTNGDTAEGAIDSIVREIVLVDMPGIGKIPIEGFASIGDIVFQKSRPARSGLRGTEVFLRTGETLHGKLSGGTAWSLRLKTAWAAEPLVIPLDMVAAVAFMEGRTMLSDMAPTSVAETPFLDIKRPWQRNRALAGGVLTVGGFQAASGLALHAKAALDFKVPAAPGETVLLAWVGVDDAVSPGAAADVRVSVDGEVKSAVQVRAGDEPLPLRVEVSTNAVTLSITADVGADGALGDHVDILYPCWVAR